MTPENAASARKKSFQLLAEESVDNKMVDVPRLRISATIGAFFSPCATAITPGVNVDRDFFAIRCKWWKFILSAPPNRVVPYKFPSLA